jgi:hypothetical protein
VNRKLLPNQIKHLFDIKKSSKEDEKDIFDIFGHKTSDRMQRNRNIRSKIKLYRVGDKMAPWGTI